MGQQSEVHKFPANVILAQLEQLNGEEYKVDAEKIKMIKKIKKKV